MAIVKAFGREFLTGFQKRKNERRKRAKEELERNLKEERKRIRQEIKDGVKHMKKSFEPLKELTDADKTNKDEYEDDDVIVKIVELSTSDLAAQRNLLGENFVKDSEESANDESSNESEDMENSANCIPGMDFDANTKRKRKAQDVSDDDSESGTKGSKKIKTEDIKSKKELDHFKKTKTMKKLKKSKVFKMKERIDKKINQKKARKDKMSTMRSLPKHLRNVKAHQKNPYSKGRKMNKKQIRKKYEK